MSHCHKLSCEDTRKVLFTFNWRGMHFMNIYCMVLCTFTIVKVV